MDFFVLLSLNVAALAVIFIILSGRIRKALDSGGAVERIRNEISALLIELNSATDRNVSLVEDRLARLKSALADADRRLLVLDRELEQRKKESDVYTRLGKKPMVSESVASPEKSSNPSSLSGPSNDSRMPFVTFSSNPVEIKSPFRERALEFRKRGFSSDIIAARLGTTIAEIDLVFAIEEQRILSGNSERT